MKQNITSYQSCILYSVLCTACLILLFSSCDKIEGPYRKPVVVNPFCQTGIADSTAHRKVLVEEFTGHFCGNCPQSSIYLSDTLKALYNHCLVIVSIHANWFANVCPNAPCPGDQKPGSFTTDFTCSTGDAWYSFFGITGNPLGLVNRIDFPTNKQVKSVGDWAPDIAAQVATKAQANLKISNNYNSLSRNLSTTITTDVLENLQGNYHLQVVLTEDSITDWQIWYGHTPEYDSSYVHRHVLRDAVNTTWGESIVSGSAAGGATITKNYLYSISNKWNADYCNIVAFIYNDDTKEVIQVEEAPVR